MSCWKVVGYKLEGQCSNQMNKQLGMQTLQGSGEKIQVQEKDQVKG